jgi:hypothetical protein
MTEFALSARATWTGADFALTVDAVVDVDGAYFIGHNDQGARLIESLRARGIHVVDGRQAFFESLGGEPEVDSGLGPNPKITGIDPHGGFDKPLVIVPAKDVHLDFGSHR